MNKKMVDDYLDDAYKAIKVTGISEDGKVKKTYRGAISTFGAAVTMGSLLSAAVFFSDNGGATVERANLAKALYLIVTGEQSDDKECLFNYVKDHRDDKERILNAAVALKLAMNLYELTE